VPPAGFAESDSNLVLVEIPADIQQVKSRDMELARQWRAHTRVLFQHYFDHKFIVTDFARHRDEADRSRSYYVLTYQHA
jgi:predicted GNAT superfamily acetyltransferase